MTTTYHSYAAGRARVLETFAAPTAGRYRVANDASAGFAVYVGVNALPDFTQPPAGFGPSPVSAPITPPVAGTALLNVVVRKRNKYGLESVEQKPTVLQIDSVGNLILPPLPTPADVIGTQRDATSVLLTASYADYPNDLYPASLWYLWVGDGVDPGTGGAPVITVPVTSTTLSRVVFSLLAGHSYHITLKMFRNSDGALSAPVTVVVPVLAPPAEPLAVFGQWAGP